MIDRYIHGEVSRVAPEAPVPVLKVSRVEERAGAAANVLANVKAMRVAAKGDFGFGHKPIIKTRLVYRNQYIARFDEDHSQYPLHELDLEGVKVVIFVDYGKGSLQNVQSLIQQAKKAGCIVLVDPKGYDYEKYRGADVVKPNLDEMRVMIGGWADEDDLEAKVRGLMNESGIKSVLLTRASAGMSLYLREAYGWKHTYHRPSVAEQVVDVSGAGEAAIAALGVGLHEGYSLKESMVFANRAAGKACGKFGTSVVTRDEVFGSVSRHV